MHFEDLWKELYYEQILRYDRWGFVPGTQTVNFKEYLARSAKKERALREVRRSPRAVLARALGAKFEAHAYQPSPSLRKTYRERTLTEPWPAILLSPSEYYRAVRRIVKPAIWLSPLFPTLLLVSCSTTAGRMLRISLDGSYKSRRCLTKCARP